MKIINLSVMALVILFGYFLKVNGAEDENIYVIDSLEEAEGWYMVMDAGSEGGEQKVWVDKEGKLEGAGALVWEVKTNSDGKFTGYEIQKDGFWD